MTDVGRDRRHSSPNDRRGYETAPDGQPGGDGRQTDEVTPSRPLPVAPFIDAVCLAVFVALGRESHGIGRGMGWYFTVLWPFALGWFAVAVSVGLYTRGDRPWLRLVLTWSVGIALALVLRAVFTHRGSFSTFAIVAYTFIGLATFAWRGFALALRRLRPVTRP